MGEHPELDAMSHSKEDKGLLIVTTIRDLALTENPLIPSLTTAGSIGPLSEGEKILGLGPPMDHTHPWTTPTHGPHPPMDHTHPWTTPPPPMDRKGPPMSGSWLFGGSPGP
jgi:hypothetical protein